MNDVLEQRLAAKKARFEKSTRIFQDWYEKTENGNCRARVSDTVEKDKWTLKLLQKE